jgi:hypothetical protein
VFSPGLCQREKLIANRCGLQQRGASTIGGRQGTKFCFIDRADDMSVNIVTVTELIYCAIISRYFGGSRCFQNAREPIDGTSTISASSRRVMPTGWTKCAPCYSQRFGLTFGLGLLEEPPAPLDACGGEFPQC